jgi:DNA-binding NtrC family response regulator
MNDAETIAKTDTAHATRQQDRESLKLLLLEESKDDAMLLLRFLRKSGIRIESHTLCSSLDHFKEALVSEEFDAIISDYNLGGFTGLDAHKVYSEMDGDIPFIIVSGAIGEEVAVDAMRLGVHDYVMKERMGRLIPALKRELKDAKLGREQRRISKELEHPVR